MNGIKVLALNCDFFKNMLKSIYGKWIWHQIIMRKNIKNDAVIMFPTYSQKLFEYIKNNLEQFLNQKKYDSVVIILDKSNKEAFNKDYEQNNRIRIVFLDIVCIETLMQFYLTEDFDKRFIIASLDQPYRRNGSRLVGKRNLTEEEIFLIGVLGLEMLWGGNFECKS